MENYSDLTIEEYLNRLASNAPVPGGGGTSALVGALGISLGNMVGSLTVGKKKYADVEEDIRSLMERGEKLRQRLESCISEDALVFEPLSKAYSLPTSTPEETEHKNQVMEACLREASSVPMNIMDASAEAIELLEEFAAKGSRLAISDAGCGAALCRSAIEAAALNVFINTKFMKDRAYADHLNAHVHEILAAYPARADAVYENVKNRLVT